MIRLIIKFQTPCNRKSLKDGCEKENHYWNDIATSNFKYNHKAVNLICIDQRPNTRMNELFKAVEEMIKISSIPPHPSNSLLYNLDNKVLNLTLGKSTNCILVNTPSCFGQDYEM